MTRDDPQRATRELVGATLFTKVRLPDAAMAGGRG